MNKMFFIFFIGCGAEEEFVGLDPVENLAKAMCDFSEDCGGDIEQQYRSYDMCVEYQKEIIYETQKQLERQYAEDDFRNEYFDFECNVSMTLIQKCADIINDELMCLDAEGIGVYGNTIPLCYDFIKPQIQNNQYLQYSWSTEIVAEKQMWCKNYGAIDYEYNKMQIDRED